MVNYQSPNLDATFSALADPTRRAIVQRLASGAATVKELARPFRVSLPAISKHLRILEDAGLIKRRRDGRLHHCRLNPTPLREAQGWLLWYQQFWEGQFDSLENYLHSFDYPPLKEEKQPWPIPPIHEQPAFRSQDPLKRTARKSLKRGPRQKS